MIDFFEPLSSRDRAFASLGFALLSLLTGWFVLNRLMLGPWLAVLGIAVVLALSTNLLFKAWPEKPPQAIGGMLEKWEKVQKRSRKTPAGRFVWNFGRSLIAGVAAYHALELTSDLSGFGKATAIFGFAVSAGFFGVQAAIWAGIAIFLFGHQLALSGLNVDLSDPGSRSALSAAWRRGGTMSWWWPIGAAAAAPIWIGLSAVSVSVGSKIAGELVERGAAAAAKKKIEARRSRRREQQSKPGGDPVLAAIKLREAAQARVEASSRGDSGPAASEHASAKRNAEQPAGKATELKGEEKLEQDKNQATLERYIAHVRSIRESQSNDIDVNTAGRRSFDRVVQALDDKQLDLLKSGSLPDSLLLVEYYNELCGFEALAMSGGDGDVVSSTPGDGDMLDEAPDLEDSEDYEMTGFDRSLPPPASPAPTANDDPDMDGDDMEPDLLDEPTTPVTVSRRAAAGLNADMAMLSEAAKSGLREGEDGAPVGGENLPLAISSDSEIVSAERFGSGSALEDDDEEVEVDAAEETGSAEETDQAEAESEEMQGEEARHVPDEEKATEKAEQQDAEDDAAGAVENTLEASGEAENAPENEGKEKVPVSDQDRRDAAGVILARKVDREFALRTMDYFSSASDAAGVIGLNEAIMSDAFAVYQESAFGARQEIELVKLLDGNDVDAVQKSLAAFDDIEWSIDPDLATRAAAWIEEKSEEARAAEEDRERVEAAKAAEVEAAAAAEAEAAKAVQLNEARRKHAVMILVGAYGDDVLDAGEQLFPDVEALANALDVEVGHIQKQFDDFTAKRLAKQGIDALRDAWRAHDLYKVQDILSSPESLEAYPGYEEVLEGARVWAKGEEAKQRILGFKEGTVSIEGGADPAAAKKLMRQMQKVTKEQADLIDNKLPRALKIAGNLESAITLMGENASDSMKGDHAKVMEQAAIFARKIVSDEKACRRYVLAFLDDTECQDGENTWDMLLRLAGAVKTVAEESVATPAPSTPVTGINRVVDMGPKVLTPEEVQALDPAEQISEMEFPALKDRDAYNRLFSLACQTYLGDDANDKSMTKMEGIFFNMYLHRKEANLPGVVTLYTSLDRIPVWYHQETDTVYLAVVADGNTIITKNGAEFCEEHYKIFRAYNDRDKVEGLVLASPYLTENGVKSFAPLLPKCEEGALLISNEHLSDKVFSDFVDRIKGA